MRAVAVLVLTLALTGCATASAPREPNIGLTVGQNKDTIRRLAGEPAYVTGEAFESFWWYYRSNTEIYVLHFKDNIFVDGVMTTSAELGGAATPTTGQRPRRRGAVAI